MPATFRRWAQQHPAEVPDVRPKRHRGEWGQVHTKLTLEGAQVGLRCLNPPLPVFVDRGFEDGPEIAVHAPAIVDETAHLRVARILVDAVQQGGFLAHAILLSLSEQLSRLQKSSISSAVSGSIPSAKCSG